MVGIQSIKIKTKKRLYHSIGELAVFYGNDFHIS